MKPRRADEAASPAPHLPRPWRDQVALVLRARGASGATIGDALAVAEAHCADSGEDAEVAFGTATEYAEAVVLPAGEASPQTGQLVRSALPTLVGLAGMMLTFATVDAWQSRTDVSVSWGLAASIVLMVAGSLVLVRRIDLLARAGGVVVAMLIGVVAVGFMTLAMVTTPTLVALPRPVAAVLSAALLVLAAVWSRRAADPDPISDPLKGDPSPRATKLLLATGPWFFPAATLVGVLLMMAIGATPGS